MHCDYPYVNCENGVALLKRGCVVNHSVQGCRQRAITTQMSRIRTLRISYTSACHIPGDKAAFNGRVGLLSPWTIDLRTARDSGATSRPLHGEGVNFLSADVAGENRGAVRGHADFGIPSRTCGTVQAFQAGDRFHFLIGKANPQEHGL
jgi:hypothetical protein